MPPLEQHKPSDNAQPAQQAGHAIQSTLHDTWGPQPFKLGATYNEGPTLSLGATADSTYTKSLATQYDNLGQSALNGIGDGFKAMLAVGEFGFELVGDAASVVTADLQIGYEKLTNPALAEVNSDLVAQHMRQLGAKYEPALQPLKQGYEWIQKDVQDIGSQSNNDNKAYGRLLTDPAHNIAEAADKFTSQTPGQQVEAIFDQGTQIAAFGLAEKALTGVLSTAQIAAKFDQLLSRMDDSLKHIRAAGSEINKGSELEYAGVPRDHFEKGETQNSQDYFLKMAGKRPDFIKNLDKLEDVFEIRAELKTPNNRNIAFAEVNIEGKQEKLIGISGIASPEGTCLYPEDPALKFKPRGFEERDDHSEFKILNQIAQGLDKNATGTVKLFSERYPCDSCEPAIDEFRREFPHIKLEIEYGKEKR